MHAKLASLALLSIYASQGAQAAAFSFEKDLLTERDAAANPAVGFFTPRHFVGKRGYGSTEKCYSEPASSSDSKPSTSGYEKDLYIKTGEYTGVNQGKKCKYIVTDPQWPSEARWKSLAAALTSPDHLIKTVPIGAACYPGQYQNATRCAELVANWSDSDIHDQDPTSIMSPFFQGNTCVASANVTGSCTLGGFPNYAVNAASARDVQAAVNFARNQNIRLVVKNTGHDFSGKSSGAHSVSVWTHNLQDIEYIPSYNKHGYKGPAFKVGAGVQVRDINAAAAKHGLMIVGGEGMTVGFAGGYIQGGGHSPLSSIHGMGSDHALEFNVVTPDGKFVTASKDENRDLFWALRGGGGSTWGVATSVTVKAYPTIPVTTLSFIFSTPNDDAFWSIIKAYFSTFNAFADAGCYSYVAIFVPQTFFFSPGIFCPNQKPADMERLFKPVYDQMAKVNVTATGKDLQYFDNYYDAWAHAFPKEPVGGITGQAASRLFPRENFANPSSNPLFGKTVQAIREVVSKYNFFIGFNEAPTLKAGGVTADETSVNPAWRRANLHAITTAQWAANATKAEIEAIRYELTHVQMKKWRDLSPGSGAYLGESDINEIDFQHSFWGNHYERLYSIKQKIDPLGVFYASTAVGSEDWSVDAKGRLCPKH
ncbi:hypothetical protein HDV00_001015 [Rhizophlyctis rosea]|nr:hypothetical protein HDV00_001015 [Rhizophlyctis rosea]